MAKPTEVLAQVPARPAAGAPADLIILLERCSLVAFPGHDFVAERRCSKPDGLGFYPGSATAAV